MINQIIITNREDTQAPGSKAGRWKPCTARAGLLTILSSSPLDYLEQKWVLRKCVWFHRLLIWEHKNKAFKMERFLEKPALHSRGTKGQGSGPFPCSSITTELSWIINWFTLTATMKPRHECSMVGVFFGINKREWMSEFRLKKKKALKTCGVYLKKYIARNPDSHSYFFTKYPWR